MADKHHPLKFLVLTDFFFPDAMGGANKMAFYTSHGLVNKGHRVLLITRRARPELPDRENIEGIEVYRFDLPRKTYPSFNSTARPQIRKILNSIEKEGMNPLDLIVLHQPIIALEGITHLFIRKTPWIYNFHSPWGEEFKISRALKWPGRINPAVLIQKMMRDWIERKVLRRCRRVIVLSRFMQERLESIHRMSKKSVIIPGGVDTAVFSPPRNQVSIRKTLGLPPDKIILFTVRNLRKRMGLMNLIRAMADLGAMGDKIHLVMAGKGELEETLKKAAEALNISERITFTGHLPEDELPKFYQAADIFILPTKYLEGFGMVTLEALATGVPVIATPIGASPEIITQIGPEWLCHDTSRQALSSKIIERVTWLTQHPDEYKKTRDLCRDLAVSQYAWPGIMEKWQECCDEVIERWQGRA